MKLVTYQPKLTQLKEVAGAFSCLLECEISKATAKAKFDGPKFPQNMWDEICAFFEWTQAECRSEAQVRLFLNPVLGTWAAWAFPQKGNMGMASTELSETTPERTAQRAQFDSSLGWLPFGTVHHHCSSDAFQSGTDRMDEVRQDGIHITVGGIGLKKYSLHCRFYASGNGFEPDMSQFFDVSNLLVQAPPWMRGFLELDAEHRFAVWKMTEPPPEEQTFPELWKTNYIIPPKPVISITSAPIPFSGGTQYDYSKYNRRQHFNMKVDMDKAARFIFSWIKDEPTVTFEEVLEQIAEVNSLPDCDKIIELFQECDVTPGPLLMHLEELQKILEQEELEQQALAEEAKANGKGRKHKGGKVHPNKDTPLLTDGGVHGSGSQIDQQITDMYGSNWSE